MIVNRTLKVRLDLAPVDLARVRATISELSQVYAKHVDYAITHKTITKSKLHDGVYARVITEHPNLPTGLVQTIRDNVRGNLKAIHSRNPKKKWKVRPQKSEYSAINYDARTITLRGEQLSFSIIGKRVQTVISIPTWFNQRYAGFIMKAATIRFDKRTQSLWANLVFRGNLPDTEAPGEALGLDRGLYSLVTTSDGEHYRAQKVRAVRRRYLYTRKKLQQKGTRSAKRLLKKLSGKEKRFMLDYNHIITKNIANNPNHNVFVLEDLTGIREQRKGKTLNTWLAQWSYYQLQTLLHYKAEALGKQVVFIDPRYTSQRCNACGVIEKKNRKKNKYACQSCGVMEHSDVNAALNIRDLYYLNLSLAQQPEQAVVNQPHGWEQISPEIPVHVQTPPLVGAGN
jgi:putative transposase